MKQMTLLGKTTHETLVETEKEEDKSKYPTEYCLNQIRSEEYLWDMRCWYKFKDEEEVRAWILGDNRDRKNCGHTLFCIDLLVKVHKVDVETIVKTIMENDKVKFELCNLKWCEDCKNDHRCCSKCVDGVVEQGT